MASPEAIWTPEPGVYEDVSASQYHSCPYASNSRLGKLVPPSTPSKLKESIDHPPKPEDEKKVWKEGRALHCAIFEPDVFKDLYRVAGTCIGETQKGERCKATGSIPVHGGEVCKTHRNQYKVRDDVLLITQAEAEMIAGCTKAFNGHPLTGPMARNTRASRELSVIWDQPVPALRPEEQPIVVRMKCRVDWYDPVIEGGLAVDAKGVRGADEDEYRKQAFYNGYLRQSVIYRWGLRANGMPAKTFAGVPIEKVPPYELVVYFLGDEATGPIWEPGMPAANISKHVLLLLRLWHTCHETGVWPGFPPRTQTLGLPEWMWSKLDQMDSKILSTLDDMKG